MPTYQQKWTHTEDGYGAATSVIRISDTDAGLLVPESGATDVGFFDVGNVEEQLEDKDAALVEDAFSFSANQAMITDADTDEIACLQLLRTAIDPTVRVFVAVFLDAPDPVTGYTIDQAAYVGEVSHDQSEEDLIWYGVEWDSTPSPLKTINFENKPLADALFDDVKLEDIINGLEEDLPDPAIEGITKDWMDANVENKQGWTYKQIGSAPDGLYVKYHMLCPLNKVLRKLSDLFALHSERKTGKSVSVVFDRVVLDGEYIPGRMKPRDDSFYQLGTESESIPGTWRKKVEWYNIKTTDKRKLALDPDAAPPDDEEQIYIDFKQISYGKYPESGNYPDGWYDKFWLLTVWEINEDESLEFMWQNHAETFSDLLYGIAYDLGLKLKLSFDDASTIRVSYIPFSTFVKPRAYLKDAEKASLDLELVDPDENRREGFSSPMARDGKWYLQSWKSDKTPISSPLDKRYRNGDFKRALLTLSPTRWDHYYSGKVNDEPVSGSITHMTNTFVENIASGSNASSLAYRDLSDDKLEMWNKAGQAITQTSAIYLNVKQLEADKYHPDEPLDFFAPACKLVMNIDGVDKEFEELSEYTGFARERTTDLTKLSKKITVPYLHGFSLSSDGSNPHWSNIRVGSEVVLDSITYTVMKITRNLAQRKTDLELVAVELASEVADAIAVTTTQSSKGGAKKNSEDPGTDAIIGTSSNAIYKDSYELGETIAKGKHVWYKSDGKIYESDGAAEEFGRGVGILLRDGVAGDLREVLELGEFAFDTAVLTPGSKVYLRKDAGSGLNVSHTPLTDKVGTEVLYKELGVAQSDKILSYRPGREGVLL